MAGPSPRQKEIMQIKSEIRGLEKKLRRLEQEEATYRPPFRLKHSK